MPDPNLYYPYEPGDMATAESLNDMQLKIKQDIADQIAGIQTVPHADSADNAHTADQAKQAGNADTADLAKQANNAATADLAKQAGNADTADLAKQANNAATADLAKQAGNADTADLAKQANNAATADLAKQANNAATADNAKEAGHALKADWAKDADNAKEAGHALKADWAKDADNAKEAGHALKADWAKDADNAKEAGHALKADWAKDADNAKEAGHALKADWAKEADNAKEAVHAKDADNAIAAGSAKTAEFAGLAEKAKEATKAVEAAKAATADYADNADHANNAENAVNAEHAKDAKEALHAIDAEHAKDAKEALHAVDAEHAKDAKEALHAVDAEHAIKADDSDKLGGKQSDELIDIIVQKAVEEAIKQTVEKVRGYGYQRIFKKLETTKEKIIVHGLGEMPLVDIYQLEYFPVVTNEDGEETVTWVNFYMYHSSERRFRKRLDNGTLINIEIEGTNGAVFKISFEDMLKFLGITVKNESSLSDVETEMWKKLNQSPHDNFDDDQYATSPWFTKCCQERMTVEDITRRGEWDDIWVQFRPRKTVNLPIPTLDKDGEPTGFLAAPVNIEVKQYDLKTISLTLLEDPIYSTEFKKAMDDETGEGRMGLIQNELKVMVLLKV